MTTPTMILYVSEDVNNMTSQHPLDDSVTLPRNGSSISLLISGHFVLCPFESNWCQLSMPTSQVWPENAKKSLGRRKLCSQIKRKTLQRGQQKPRINDNFKSQKLNFWAVDSCSRYLWDCDLQTGNGIVSILSKNQARQEIRMPRTEGCEILHKGK